MDYDDTNFLVWKKYFRVKVIWEKKNIQNFGDL